MVAEDAGTGAAARATVFEELGADDPERLGDYTLVARLGAGGMGKVYLSHTRAGRPVAIKAIRPELADDPAFRRRFRREVAAAQRVHGLHTAPVIDSDIDGTPLWLATAFVEGPTLSTAVTRHGPLPVPAVLLLAAGVAEALQDVHGAGIVHRDLKASNVLLAMDGPRVIDFGIARAADATALTDAGSAVGTPAFMSPEQAQDKDVGPATDVFSLGQLIAYAARGTPAFGEGQAFGVLYRIVHEEPDLADVPEALLPLLNRCLAKDPGERPSPAEVIELCRAASGDDMLRRPGTWLPEAIIMDITRHHVPERAPTGVGETRQPARKPVPRRTVLALGATVLTAAGSAAAVMGLREDSDPKSPGNAAGRKAAAKNVSVKSTDILIGHVVGINSLSFSPDGKSLATSSGPETVHLWDLTKNENEPTLPGEKRATYSVAFSPDGKTLATGNGGDYEGVHLRDAKTGRIRTSLTGVADKVLSVAYSPDGKTLAASSAEDVLLWDVESAKRTIALPGHNTMTNSVAFSPDGKTLATGSDDKQVRLWDTATGRRRATLTGHKGQVNAVAFSPDGKTLASGGYDKQVRLWDAATGRHRATLTGHKGQVNAVAFSPDGKTLATAGHDKTVRLWDMRTGKRKATLTGHRNAILCLSFSPDGRTLATGSEDRMVRLWRAGRGVRISAAQIDQSA
ncbi:hypothetical protein GCM10009801_42260 [Streptomyces albiaxialis]|uniref:Protein kinase domain-containing protein n=1 Tax=Streptomyces albiaxialis TaxID=329523 RepID=A0ABP5HMN5_9ACTN